MQYTGEPREGLPGLVDLRARVYDPQLGRFLQRDTIAGAGVRPSALNRYSYVEGNPVNAVDPGGHIAWIPAIVLIGAGVGAIGNTANYLLNSSDRSAGGALGAAGVGALAGASGTAAGLGAVAVAGSFGVVGASAAAAGGVANGIVYNAVSNLFSGAGLLDNFVGAGALGGLAGPYARSLAPEVGRRATYSVTRGLGSPAGGYAGRNTLRVYGQEAASDTASQAGGLALLPVRGAPSLPTLPAGPPTKEEVAVSAR